LMWWGVGALREAGGGVGEDGWGSGGGGGGGGGGGVRVDFWAEGFSNNSSKFKIFIDFLLLF